MSSINENKKQFLEKRLGIRKSDNVEMTTEEFESQRISQIEELMRKLNS
jgi:predicted DNA-binding protein (UPF0251 family)